MCHFYLAELFVFIGFCFFFVRNQGKSKNSSLARIVRATVKRRPTFDGFCCEENQDREMAANVVNVRYEFKVFMVPQKHAFVEQ